MQIWTCVIPSPPPSISELLLHIWSSEEDSKLDESFSLSFVISQAFSLSLESYLVQICRKYIEFFVSRTAYILLNLIGIFLLIKKYRKCTFLHLLSAVSVQCSILMHLTIYWCVSLNGLLYWNLSFYNDWKDFLQGERSTSLKGQVCSYRRTWLLMSPCIFNSNKLISAFLSSVWPIKTVWWLCNHI